VDAHHVLCDEQHGFRHRRSCESQLISTIDDFASCPNDGGQCDVLFLDFGKAFNRVLYLILIYFTNSTTMAYVVLYWNGLNRFWLITPNMLFWTTVVAMKLAFYQVSHRAPSWHLFYFLLYINDLPQCVRNRIKLHADDVLLYSVIHSKADCVWLQEDLKV